MTEPEDEQYRIDKWLWAARFFKTRSLAKEAINGGKIHCQGERCKPSKIVRIGDELVIRTGYDERTVLVIKLSAVRRGAPEAQLLYQETPTSIQKRESNLLARQQGMIGVQTQGKPTKKQRRKIHQFRQTL